MAAFIKDATARLVVEIAKREWPQQWPTMLQVGFFFVWGLFWLILGLYDNFTHPNSVTISELPCLVIVFTYTKTYTFLYLPF